MTFEADVNDVTIIKRSQIADALFVISGATDKGR
jgi:hypothetical protein